MKYNILDINITVSKDVEYILHTLRNAGYEAYIVGGCVRDSILGRAPKDWDITTAALPEQVKSLFPVTIDTGIAHGTVMVIRGGSGYEVTTYRIDGEYKDGRHPERVTFTPSLEEDLKRRDFTVNAFAYSPEEGVVDLFGGADDLNNGLIRAVGDPRQRFAEDALRIMRAVRFAAQLSFEIEKETMDAISEFGPKLAKVSAERIRVEFEKTLFSPNPDKVNLYKKLGLAAYVIPVYSDKCFDTSVEDYYLKKTDTEASVPDTKTVADDTLVDINTAGTRLPEADNISETGGILAESIRYINLALFFHNLTAEECSYIMRKMTFDNKSRETVCKLLQYKEDMLQKTRTVIKNMLRQLGADIFDLLLLFREAQGEKLDNVREEFRNILESGEAFDISMLAVNGRDLIDAGLAQGPAVGAALSDLLDAVIEDPKLNKKEMLLDLCHKSGSNASGE